MGSNLVFNYRHGTCPFCGYSFNSNEGSICKSCYSLSATGKNSEIKVKPGFVPEHVRKIKEITTNRLKNPGKNSSIWVDQ